MSKSRERGLSISIPSRLVVLVGTEEEGGVPYLKLDANVLRCERVTNSASFVDEHHAMSTGSCACCGTAVPHVCLLRMA